MGSQFSPPSPLFSSCPSPNLPFISLSHSAFHSLLATGKQPPKKQGRVSHSWCCQNHHCVASEALALGIEEHNCPALPPHRSLLPPPKPSSLLEEVLVKKFKSKYLGHFPCLAYFSLHSLVMTLHLSPLSEVKGKICFHQPSG